MFSFGFTVQVRDALLLLDVSCTKLSYVDDILWDDSN